ncbi:Gp49 family protein [Bacillus sp. EB600]|uniref:Gp49 family protein n=1 Tax=Bacillus sp. EB600 TaxID=2806345 RepID=UPI0021089872|nr:Gp49 family protein [Bacillus sp. EB600]MCQ6282387.1 hypothetical protein [Bacillus sp. EB600]
MYIDSICPKCGEISHVKYKGEEMIVVTCKNHHMYDHIVIPLSGNGRMKDDKRIKLEEMITEKKFHRMSNKTVICLLIFKNGYEVEGRATVRDAADFHLVIGKDIAYEHALKRAMVALSSLLT